MTIICHDSELQDVALIYKTVILGHGMEYILLIGVNYFSTCLIDTDCNMPLGIGLFFRVGEWSEIKRPR